MKTQLFLSIVMIVIAGVLSGCGALDRAVTKITGDLTYKCSKSGVEYVQSDSGLSVHVNQDGTPVKCQ